MAGAWSMTEYGEFILGEPYASELKSIKFDAMNAWILSVTGNLARQTGYTQQQLAEAFRDRCMAGERPMEIVDAFVVQALEGEL